MKRLFITLALFAVASLAPSQTPTQSATPTTTSDVDKALRLYKERASEGAAPMLILKDGGATLTEKAQRAQIPPGEFPSNAPDANPPDLEEINALKDQVKALKKLNAALEEELAKCGSSH